MSTLPEHDVGKLPAPAKGLLKRIQRGALTEPDLKTKARSLALWQLRNAGKTWAECGEAMGEKKTTLRCFAAASIYQTWVATFKTAGSGGEAAPLLSAEHQATTHRETMRILTPLALARLEHTLRRFEQQDSRSADRAMELVLGSQGLLEAEHTARPVIHINQLVVNQQVAAARADDAAIAAAYTVVPAQIEATA